MKLRGQTNDAAVGSAGDCVTVTAAMLLATTPGRRGSVADETVTTGVAVAEEGDVPVPGAIIGLSELLAA